MENELRKFENEVLGSIRAFEKEDGMLWFVAKDICDALGIKNSREAVSSLDEDEKTLSRVPTPGGRQEMSMVNEFGLYSLVFKSRMPSARTFKKWVTSEVFPALRKTVRYEIKDATRILPQFARFTSLQKYNETSPKGKVVSEILKHVNEIGDALCEKKLVCDCEVLKEAKLHGVSVLQNDMGIYTVRLVVEVLKSCGYQINRNGWGRYIINKP